MSNDNKLSLWQKLKHLLASSAPKTIVDTVEVNSDLLSVSVVSDTSNNHDNSAINNEANKELAKVSLVKNQTAETDPTPIVDYLKNYLHNKQWHYTYYRPRKNDRQHSHHLSLRMRNKNLDCGYLFRVQEKNALLAVYGILPFLIPESHQSAAMLLITQINYDMMIGSLELDINDGEIRYKNAIDIEAVGINDDIIEHLLQSVVAMTTVAYEIFNDLLSTQYPSEDMSSLLSELRLQADARTFFLASQKKQ